MKPKIFMEFPILEENSWNDFARVSLKPHRNHRMKDFKSESHQFRSFKRILMRSTVRNKKDFRFKIKNFCNSSAPSIKIFNIFRRSRINAALITLKKITFVRWTATLACELAKRSSKKDGKVFPRVFLYFALLPKKLHQRKEGEKIFKDFTGSHAPRDPFKKFISP